MGMVSLLQIVVVVFGLVCVGMSVAAVIVLLRNPSFPWRWLWIIGSLMGFVGIGVDWTNPDDLYLEFGVMISPVQIFKPFVLGHWLVKVTFPFIAAVVLMGKQSIDNTKGAG